MPDPARTGDIFVPTTTPPLPPSPVVGNSVILVNGLALLVAGDFTPASPASASLIVFQDGMPVIFRNTPVTRGGVPGTIVPTDVSGPLLSWL